MQALAETELASPENGAAGMIRHDKQVRCGARHLHIPRTGLAFSVWDPNDR